MVSGRWYIGGELIIFPDGSDQSPFVHGIYYFGFFSFDSI